MTLVPSTSLREVDGKWRLDEPCGCAFLFERTPANDGWKKYHVRACNGRFEDGRHRRRQVESVATLPRVNE